MFRREAVSPHSVSVTGTFASQGFGDRHFRLTEFLRQALSLAVFRRETLMKEIQMGFAFGIVMMPDNLSFGDKDYFELGSSGFTGSSNGEGEDDDSALHGGHTTGETHNISILQASWLHGFISMVFASSSGQHHQNSWRIHPRFGLRCPLSRDVPLFK